MHHIFNNMFLFLFLFQQKEKMHPMKKVEQAKQAGKNIINVKNKKPAKSWPTSQKGPKS